MLGHGRSSVPVPEEVPFMASLPLSVMIGVCGVLLVGTIYFVWSRNFSKKSES
jgi:hypothetical protein